MPVMPFGALVGNLIYAAILFAVGYIIWILIDKAGLGSEITWAAKLILILLGIGVLLRIFGFI